MSETKRLPCGYQVVRYMPNLLRDEWINIGIVLFDSESGRVLRRLMDEEAQFARVRRLHPQADENLLRRLPEEIEAQFAAANGDGMRQVARLNDTLADTVQLGPQHGLFAEDLVAELDRLYQIHVEPPRAERRLDDLSRRSAVLLRANRIFRSTGVWPRLERRVSVDDFTFPGDPLRIDYAYRRNGTRGFVQALPLSREPAQAKTLAFTAGAIREKLAKTEFLAISEVEPRPQDNQRHRFIAGLFEKHDIAIVPLSRLAEWAQRIRPSLLAPSGN
jgi:hypothetical protein